MPDTVIPYGDPGRAAFELDGDYLNPHLLNGSHPALSPAVYAEAGADIERFELVGFNAAGELVPAVHSSTPADVIKPVGIAVSAAADGERAGYWYAGHFNADNLVFPVSFNTDALKLGAFNDAPTPTQIRLSSRSGSF